MSSSKPFLNLKTGLKCEKNINSVISPKQEMHLNMTLA